MGKHISTTRERVRYSERCNVRFSLYECLHGGPRWVGAIPGRKLISDSGIRTRIDVLFRMAGDVCVEDGSRLSPHSVRSGGASATFAAGYEVEAIKRWGLWIPSTSQQYLWRDHRTMSTIGRGMVPPAIRPALGKNLGRAGGRNNHVEGKDHPNGRMRGISRELAKLLRRRNMEEKQRGGFAPVNAVLETPNWLG